jgi:hypothetical protein
MTQETIKVTQMETLESVTGDEYVMVVVNGANYKVNARNLYREELPLTTKDALGLDMVDNTSDLAKPISTATQTALDVKANNRHNHIVSDVQDLQTELDLKANVDHVHAISQVANLQNSLDNKLEQAALDTGLATKANVTDLQAGLATKANAMHGHVIGDLAGLQASLDLKLEQAALDAGLATKAEVVHSHEVANVTGLQVTTAATVVAAVAATVVATVAVVVLRKVCLRLRRVSR